MQKRGLLQGIAGLLLITLTLTVPRSARAESAEKVIHTFTLQMDGGSPLAGLISDPNGNLYGTTELGDPWYGTVFELTRNSDSWTYQILYGFCLLRYCADGAYPEAGVFLDRAGNIYGTTSAGGTGDSGGAVFQLKPPTGSEPGFWREQVIGKFQYDNGNDVPLAGVILDKAGNIYGTTSGLLGFSSLSGTVFELVRQAGGGWKHQVLHRFTGGDDGGHPTAPLTFDEAGNLYGTTGSGGRNEHGTVFRLVPNLKGGWTEDVLYDFPEDGPPSSGVAFDQEGNLYGTTSDGEVFKLTPSAGTWTETILYTFTGGSDGAGPRGVTMDRAGNLFGVAAAGGLPGCQTAQGCGTVFELSPSADGWTETTLYSFSGGDDGGNPRGTLLLDHAGRLYGVANWTGGGNWGVVFEVDP